MCNICGCSPTIQCGCYNSVANTCPPTLCPTPACPPAVAPPPPFPFDGIYVQYARVLTSQADFFNMPVTPKILLPTPGPGKMIVPIKIFNILEPLAPAVPYQDILTNTPVMLINLGTFGLISDAAVLAALATQTTFYNPGIATVAGTLDNQPLTLTTNVQSVVGSSNLYSYITYITVNI